MKPKLMDRSLIKLSEGGGDGNMNPPRRWYLGATTFEDRYLRIGLYPPGLVSSWPRVEYTEHLDCSVNHPEVTEDFPCCWPPQPQVVSHGMRLFLEKHAPGDGQFLPITIRQRKGRFFDIGAYWCVQWVKVIDCIDWERSRWKKQRNDEGLEWFEFAYMGAIFDPTKVPDDVQIFRPYGIPAHCVLIKSAMAKKLKRAKFTGPQFKYVSLSTDPVETLDQFAQPYAAFGNWKELN